MRLYFTRLHVLIVLRVKYLKSWGSGCLIYRTLQPGSILNANDWYEIYTEKYYGKGSVNFSTQSQNNIIFLLNKSNSIKVSKMS